MKKRICALCCLICMLTLLFCFPETYAGTQTVTLNADKTTVAPGEEFEITLDMTAAEGFNGIGFMISYDSSKVTFKGFTAASGFTVLVDGSANTSTSGNIKTTDEYNIYNMSFPTTGTIGTAKFEAVSGIADTTTDIEFQGLRFVDGVMDDQNHGTKSKTITIEDQVTIASNTYTIDNSNLKIDNVPDGTTIAQLLSNITVNPTTATMEVVDSNGQKITDQTTPIGNGMQLSITKGGKNIKYDIIEPLYIRPKASTGYTESNNTIMGVKRGTKVLDFISNDVESNGTTVEVYLNGTVQPLTAEITDGMVVVAKRAGSTDVSKAIDIELYLESNTLTITDASHGDYIRDIQPKQDFQLTFGTGSTNLITNGTVTIYKDSTKAQTVTSGDVATGMYVEVTKTGYTPITKTIIVKGDVNGDGKVDFFSDLLAIGAHINNSKLLTGISFEAADLNGDGDVQFFGDFLKMTSYIQNKIATL